MRDKSDPHYLVEVLYLFWKRHENPDNIMNKKEHFFQQI